jgi:hypothetical protein
MKTITKMLGFILTQRFIMGWHPIKSFSGPGNCQPDRALKGCFPHFHAPRRGDLEIRARLLFSPNSGWIDGDRWTQAERLSCKEIDYVCKA